MPRIFTRRGDKGETSWINGKRVPKDDPLIEANGTIDECNSLIGVARSYIADERLNTILERFQNQLITAGSETADFKYEKRPSYLVQDDIKMLEELINEFEQHLEPLTNFILPAGGKASAHLHLARTASRKVERRLSTLRKTVKVNPLLPAYFNRLSDTLFVLARQASKLAGINDTVSVPS